MGEPNGPDVARNIILVLLTMMTYMVTSLSNTMLVPNFLTVVAGLRPEQVGGVLLLYTALPLVVAVPAAVWLLHRMTPGSWPCSG